MSCGGRGDGFLLSLSVAPRSCCPTIIAKRDAVSLEYARWPVDQLPTVCGLSACLAPKISETHHRTLYPRTEMANLIKKMLEDSGLSFGDSTDPQKKGVYLRFGQ